MTYDEALEWLKAIGARTTISRVSGSYEIVAVTVGSAVRGEITREARYDCLVPDHDRQAGYRNAVVRAAEELKTALK